jgi:hypothetical protein
MARIRSIKPGFWQDEKLSPLPSLERLVFLGLISQADDAGRLVDNVRLIDGLLFPQTEDTSRDALDTLARLKRILRYQGPSGQRLIQIVRWKDHQKVDNPSLHVFPAPTLELLAVAPDSESSGETREDIATVSILEVGDGIGDVGVGKVEGTTDNDVRGRVREALPESYRPDFDSLLDVALATAAEREAWVRSLHAVFFDGYEFPTHDPELLGQGLRQMLGARGAPTWRKYAGFVRPLLPGYEAPASQKNGSNGHGKIEPAIELAAGKQLEEIQKLKVRTQTSVGIKFHIPVASLEELPPAVQSAIAALGGSLTSGAQRILDTPGDKYGILLSQFTKLYAGAIQTERARISA